MPKETIVKVRVTKEERREWKALAARFGLTLSEFLRRAVKEKGSADGKS